MSIKLALLKSGETIISDIKELLEEEKLCGYVFQNPHKILMEKTILLSEEKDYDSKLQISLTPWIILTDDNKILVSPDWVITIVEPITSVKNLYEEKIDENYQVSFTES